MTREKETDRLPKELVQGYKVQPKEVTEKVREEIRRLRALKEAEKQKKKTQSVPAKREPRPLRLSKLAIQEAMPTPTLTQKKYLMEGPSSGASTTKAHEMHPTQFVKKKPDGDLTWQGLGKISYRDIKGNDNFNPASLLAGGDQVGDDKEYDEIISKLTGKNGAESAVITGKGEQKKDPKKKQFPKLTTRNK